MSVNPTDHGQKPEAANPWALALGAGTELVVSVLLGVVAGRWLDGKFGTAPWLMLLGAMAGIVLGLYQLIKASAQRKGDCQKRG